MTIAVLNQAALNNCARFRFIVEAGFLFFSTFASQNFHINIKIQIKQLQQAKFEFFSRKDS